MDDVLKILRCPRTGSKLVKEGTDLIAEQSGARYPIIDSIPDLRITPEKLSIEVPWFDPWDELESVDLSFPPFEDIGGLPYHLDRYLASIPGTVGANRLVLEVGCGERQCEAWFRSHGFRYLGLDFDRRGLGPHVQADAHCLPVATESVDFCTSMAVYEHLISPLTAALEAHRVLRVGGEFFGSAAFVYGFHDRASFHHMSHAGLFWTLRSAGFDVIRMWPDWRYTHSIPEMAFRGLPGAPWRIATRVALRFAEASHLAGSNLIRRIVGKPAISVIRRNVHFAGSISFHAQKSRPTGPCRMTSS